MSSGLGCDTLPPMAESTTPLDELLGRGILLPFQRDLKNDFANGGGRRLVQSAVKFVIGTDAQGELAEGEIPWRPEFGSLLYLLKHRKGRIVNELIRQYAQDALARWEPRIVITNVSGVDFDRQRRLASAKLSVSLINENNPRNQVLIEGVEVEIPII